MIAVATVITRIGYTISVIFQPTFFKPSGNHIVDCLFSMLQYQFFLQQICSFLELKETLITFSKCQSMNSESTEYQDKHSKLLKKIKSIRRWVLIFAVLGFVSIIITTFLLTKAYENKNIYLYNFLVSYFILVCVVFGAQIAHTNVKLYQTFKKVFNGEIEREDKQILFYVLIFSICYLFMFISNVMKLAHQFFTGIQFNLGAYIIEDFFSIAYLAWVHQLNYGG